MHTNIYNLLDQCEWCGLRVRMCVCVGLEMLRLEVVCLSRAEILTVLVRDRQDKTDPFELLLQLLP